MTLVFTRRNRSTPRLSGKKIGAPGVYSPALAEIALGGCLLGGTNKDLAVLFGVHEQCITDWMNRHPEFRAAVEEGRTQADAQVAHSLYQRAVGYTVVNRRVETVTGRGGFPPAEFHPGTVPGVCFERYRRSSGLRACSNPGRQCRRLGWRAGNRLWSGSRRRHRIGWRRFGHLGW
jgi:hypothetical protein